MDFGLVSAIIDAVLLSSSALRGIANKKKERKVAALVVALTNVDPEQVQEAVGKLQIAAMMRGAVTDQLVLGVTKTTEFKGRVKELFVARLAGRDDVIPEIVQGLGLLFSSTLNGKAGDDDIEYFADRFVLAMDQAIRETISGLTDLDARALPELVELANSRRLVAVVEAIERHLQTFALQASTLTPEDRKRWLNDYRRQCLVMHGHITPPDFETSRRIPIRELYVAPPIYWPHESIDQRLKAEHVDDFKVSFDRTVLLGDPGGGKSTMSNYLATVWADDPDGPIPFHITLREFATQAETQSVLEYVIAQCRVKYQHEAPDGLVETLLLSGAAVVVFDGLDELVDTTKRRSIVNIVEAFANKYPLARILVTSRRVGYEQAQLDTTQFVVRRIHEFTDEQVEEYVNRWFQAQDEYSEEQAANLAQSFITQSLAVKDLRSNPLMLALMCIIFRGENFIPRNRPDVYKKCAELLFEKWDGHRAIEVPLQAKAHIDSAMKFIAFHMLESGEDATGMELGRLVSVMATYLRDRAFDDDDTAQRAATEFVDFCKGRAWVFTEAGTTADGEGLFTFTHRTFMEYFAAFHLTRVFDTPEKLAKSLISRVAKEQWDVVAQLAIQIKDKNSDRGADRIIETMLDDPRRRSHTNRGNILTFLATCTSFATLSPGVLRKLNERVINYFCSYPNHAHAIRPSIMPWLRLWDSVQDEQTALLEQAHVEILEGIFEFGAEDEQYRAAYIVMFGSCQAWGPRYRHFRAGLEETSGRLVTHFKDSLHSLAATNPYLWIPIAVCGVVDFRTALENVKANDFSFGQIYFASVLGFVENVPLFNGIAGTFTHVLIGYSWRQEELAQAEELAEIFRTDFLDDQFALEELSLQVYGYPMVVADSLSMDISTTPQSIRDMAILSMLTLEGVRSRFIRSQRRRFSGELTTKLEQASEAGELDSALAPFELSQDVVDKIRGWLEGGTLLKYSPDMLVMK